MLLRSSSTPILRSWISLSKDSPEQPLEIVHQIPRARSIVSLSLSSASSPAPLDSRGTMTRAFSETDLRDFSVAAAKKKKPMSQILDEFDEDEEDVNLGFGLGASVKMALYDVHEVVGDGRRVSVLVGGGAGGNGGKSCGGGSGGGGGGSDDESSGQWDSNRGNGNIELYYQTMIEANPGNALLLSNYAKFLKDVRGDFVKAEAYCGRAILANPSDGSVLSMYADLIWRSHKDSSRAEAYFDQAIKASPDDCFVMASYAQFLWDAEDEEEEEGGDVEEATNEASTPHLFNGSPPTPPPLAAST